MITAKKIILRKTEQSDLETLFLFQLDIEANYLAAFTPRDPTDKAAYLEKWIRNIANPASNMQTIVIDGLIIGSVLKYEMEGEAEASYWIAREYWGQGIAATALNDFLKSEQTRPIYGHVTFDNYGSQRVLEKCGFIRIGEEKGFANARQMEIVEYVYKLM